MSKAIRATLTVASANNAALEAVCAVLKQPGRGFDTCRELSEAVRDALYEADAPPEAFEYVTEELGVAVDDGR